MRVLVVGGTGVIGTGITQQLVEAGHDVVVYNRGQTAASIPSAVEVVRGDRTDHDAFESRAESLDVDAVVDMDVSYGSVAVLALTLTAPTSFLPDATPAYRAAVTARAVGVGAIFSVVGAATADSVF